MALKGDTFTFSIAERGETSGEKFNWAFTAKKRLSVMERIRKDAIRRSLVGERPQDAGQDTVLRAEMLAQVAVSITDSPQAFKESGNGADLYDDNILIAIYEAIAKGQEEAQKEVDKANEETKEKLRKVARAKKGDTEPEEEAGGEA